MKIVKNDWTNPFFNLALEEYLLKQSTVEEDFFLFYRNSPSIIIGRNQNPFEEINFSPAKENAIPIIRRISGGGAVFHDFGNLNFSFITSTFERSLANYRKFTSPIIEALNKLGVLAEFSGKSDIVVNGRKISGNAQAYHGKKMIHHGTLLFDCDLRFIDLFLHKDLTKAVSRSIKSNRANVTNISDFLDPGFTIEDLRNYLCNELLKRDDFTKEEHRLSEMDIRKISQLAIDKYASWEWNFGETPEFVVERILIVRNKPIKCSLVVRKGIIVHILPMPPYESMRKSTQKKYLNRPYDQTYPI